MKIIFYSITLLLLLQDSFGQTWSSSGDNSTTGSLSVSGTIFGGQYQMLSNDGLTGFYIQKPTATGEPFRILLGSQSIAGGIMIGRTDWGSKVLIPWNVGIGTTTPAAKLDVVHTSNTDWAASILNNGGSGKGLYIKSASGNTIPALQIDDLSGNNRFMVRSDGNVGIGKISPTEKLEIGGYDKVNIRVGQWATLGIVGSHLATVLGNNVKASSTNNNMEILTTNANDGAKAIKMQYNEGITFHTLIGSVTAGDAFSSERMRIDNNGNVGIGTTSPGSFKLAVNGKVWAQEVQVALTNPGPDYVFEPNYKLLSLEEIKSYIDLHKHLPEVPSAKEMETNGVNVSEMNMLLLKKIEELTLYVIKQNEAIQNQAKINAMLVKEIEILKK